MLNELKKRKIIKLFTMYDSGNRGYLQFSDYEKIAHRFAELRNWKSGTPECQKILNKYGYQWISMHGSIQEKLNHHLGNHISLEEWLDYYELVFQEQDYRQQIKSLAELVFDVIDLDESGHLDQSEWETLFQVYNIPVVYAAESFAKIDINHDGWLSREEVLLALREFYDSDDPEAAGNYIFGPI